MSKIAALVSKKHDNVFDPNSNVMLHLPKSKMPKAKTEETVFTSVRHLSPSMKILKNTLIWLIVGALCALTVAGITLSLVFSLKLDQYVTPSQTTPATTTYTLLKSVGQSCTKSSECIASAQCDVGTGSGSTSTCVCSPQLYFDSSSGACLTRKGYGESCTSSAQCEWNDDLSCVNNVCDCDTTYFFYSTTTLKCEGRKGLGEICTGDTNECISNLACYTYNSMSYTTCNCNWGYYFSFASGTCLIRKQPGQQCNQYAHFECMQNSFCTLFPNEVSTYRCSCYPTMYYNQNEYYWSCLYKKSYASSYTACTYSYECLDNDGQSCISSQCQCNTKFYWNGTYCIPYRPLGGECDNSQSQCLYGASNFDCYYRPAQGNYGCLCAPGYYYDLASGTCSALLTLGSTCVDTYQCPLNSSCVQVGTTSNKVCACDSTYYYQYNSTTCALLRGWGQTCGSSSQCLTVNGLTCDSSTGTCKCASGYFYNGNNTCEYLYGADSYKYSKYCTGMLQCKTALNHYNCYNGKCQCDPGYNLTASGLVCS